MSFHFGSSEYASCFDNLPAPPDTNTLREQTLQHIESLDPDAWKKDPVYALLKGEQLKPPDSAKPVTTLDGIGRPNGLQYYATPEQVKDLKEHILTYQPPAKDLRAPLRAIEAKILSEHAGFLIGNQCLDFGKQDGLTEIEESVMANEVERKLNDLLFRDEQEGKLVISRKPIYVSCVSNFSNFLDLFRKTIRNIELGVPCVVLGRSNTTVQHPYRWTLLLMEMMKEANVDPGMLTFLSCPLDDIKDITQSLKENTGNLYATCSRELAAAIKSGYPNTIASTGGPNTLVATEWTPGIREAVRISATIESSGQCTALRHCVVPPSVQTSEAKSVFDNVQVIPSPRHAVKNAIFDGVFAKHAGTPEPNDNSYTHLPAADAYFKVGDKLPADGIQEHWRKVVVDFSQMDVASSDAAVADVAAWLNKNQPISLAVNAPRAKSLALVRSFFEQTGLVVNTVGSSDDDSAPPALTCQARPQEAEVFGEFPPRGDVATYTKYPVVIPSSTPAYDAAYTPKFLKSAAPPAGVGPKTKSLLEEVKDDSIRGYCHVLLDYLVDATKENPKLGFGTSRTALWGLQRPPKPTKTYLRCPSTQNSLSWDSIAPLFVLFHSTNAREHLDLSVDPTHNDLIEACQKLNLDVNVEAEDSFVARTSGMTNGSNVVKVNETMTQYPMLGQFVSLYLPVGHIKSTKPNDEEFVSVLKASTKWLKADMV